jgi:hypothetical protein
MEKWIDGEMEELKWHTTPLLHHSNLRGLRRRKLMMMPPTMKQAARKWRHCISP